MIAIVKVVFKSRTNPPDLVEETLRLTEPNPVDESYFSTTINNRLEELNKDLSPRYKLYEVSHTIFDHTDNLFFHTLVQEVGQGDYTCTKCGLKQESLKLRRPYCKVPDGGEKTPEFKVIDIMKAGGYILQRKGKKAYILIDPQKREEFRISAKLLIKIGKKLKEGTLGEDRMFILK